MLVTAPDPLRVQLRGHSAAALLGACIPFEPDTAAMADPLNATIVALRSLARRTRELRREAAELKRNLATAVSTAAPRSLAVFGLVCVHAGPNGHRSQHNSAEGTARTAR